MSSERVQSAVVLEPWWDVHEAAQHAKIGEKQIYKAVKQGAIRHVLIGGRRELRFRPRWVDEWLESMARPVVEPLAPLRIVEPRR